MVKRKNLSKISVPGIYQTNSAEETIALAQNLGSTLKGQEIVYLIGELGAGKTVFTKGLAVGLGVEDINQVCSPSFTLINIYQGKCPIFHLDLYRVNSMDDLATLGWEDFLGQGVIVIEWAEKLKLELAGIEVKMFILGNSKRRIELNWRKSL
ncbi:MAG: tRNA (adenosine(37)-N6)-threonylcarbamoyltransferase complex ATPase subunit type 1 TsaE [Candidatus Aminicenantes bacterium]|nr:tRNA (adenosine(37)-N6)-threonylcarbamoyltransferase complex ATPase subunit type 1 TsaE [Candidatus Aminicenantes bacterium]RLE00250.1 MAG: tRNA (adenosine(37)-N6)-threonylcarbamoyltransferase complex ATPase subunit type 1 TsaE [Candidatus Aminicenantes bacterium]RLE01684.1 MAG: tRNA (adenosine(37)-N6)-threonylcarbamoyltransferase complex ATPase subunit type 1 TsaE [Candidatus Aminicenantes bacterium]HHF43037.1 tRNA (adenosine(37)-N6)-threonylcarbamoyltransferase complex ATPase subunit type 1